MFLSTLSHFPLLLRKFGVMVGGGELLFFKSSIASNVAGFLMASSHTRGVGWLLITCPSPMS